MSAPVEFQTSLDVFLDAGVWCAKWDGVFGLDLRWVAGAMEYLYPPAQVDATQVLMAGSRDWRIIDVPYSKFMEMWTAHMEGRTK